MTRYFAKTADSPDWRECDEWAYEAVMAAIRMFPEKFEGFGAFAWEEPPEISFYEGTPSASLE